MNTFIPFNSFNANPTSIILDIAIWVIAAMSIYALLLFIVRYYLPARSTANLGGTLLGIVLGIVAARVYLSIIQKYLFIGQSTASLLLLAAIIINAGITRYVMAEKNQPTQNNSQLTGGNQNGIS